MFLNQSAVKRVLGGSFDDSEDLSVGENFGLEAVAHDNPDRSNAAGPSANAVAACLSRLNPKFIPQLHSAKGNYVSVTGKPAFWHLICPAPEPGIGVHLTLNLNGGIRFGPDVEWIDAIDYRAGSERADHFYGEIRKYRPALPNDSPQPTSSGTRPKLSTPREPDADFVIQCPEVHGVVNLFGIERSGVTSSLAILVIAEHAVRLPAPVRP